MSQLSAKAVCVPEKDVSTFWPLAAPWIKSAMERGDLGSFETVQADVLGFNALLWVMWDDPLVMGATVTQIITQGDRKICMIVACGGEDAKSWIHLVDDIERYAKAEECDLMRIIGRKGWQKMLPEYFASRVILEKVI